MAEVLPFSCCRPTPHLASEVAAPPYDVMDRSEVAEEIARHPLSFLRIERPAALFSAEVNESDTQVYEMASAILGADLQSGLLLTDAEPHYFIYRLEQNGHSQTGVVACAAIDDYLNGVIKRHENTRAEKEYDRICHIDTCNIQSSPVFLAHRPVQEIDRLLAEAIQEQPLYDFTAEDGVKHTVWRIDDSAVTQGLVQAYSQLDALYIADGHHRAASAVAVGLKRRAAAAETTSQAAALAEVTTETIGSQPQAPAPAQHESFLAILFSSNQLQIMDYNRVVADLNGLSQADFLTRVAQRFTVEAVETGGDTESAADAEVNAGVKTGTDGKALAGSAASMPQKPGKKGEFGMYLPGQWYKLTIREEYKSNDPVAGLDVQLLQDNLLSEVLGIDDPRTSPRIDFVGGARGLSELERRVDAGEAVAFALYPVTLDELFAVSDAGRLMPPKSTWFEPKPRSGLFVHMIS